MERGVWLCCVWLPGYGSIVNQNWFLIIRPGESRDGGMKRQRERERVPLRMLGVCVVSSKSSLEETCGVMVVVSGHQSKEAKSPHVIPRLPSLLAHSGHQHYSAGGGPTACPSSVSSTVGWKPHTDTHQACAQTFVHMHTCTHSRIKTQFEVVRFLWAPPLDQLTCACLLSIS